MADDIYDRPKGLFSRIRTVLVGVLVGMLVLAFAVWGIEDVFSPNSSNAVVKVGDAEVGREAFLDRFNEEMRRISDEAGEGMTPQQAYDRGIPQQLVGEFTQRLAIEADAEALGIGVNNRDIVRYAENIDAFRNSITQQFDRTQLQRILASNRMTEADFERDARTVLVQRQTIPAVMGGILAPGDYAQRYNRFVNETRRARLVRFDASALETLPEPTEDELRSFIAANQSRFIAPEYRRFLMIRIEPFDLERDIEVTDDQLRERFETLIGAGEIGAVETRDVSIIAVPTQAIADNAAARLSAGEALDAVVASLDLPAPDTFDAVKEDGLINPASSTAAFEAEAGTARVAPTGFGSFEVVYVRNINPADEPDFDSMRDELTADVLQGEALRTINDYERVIDDRLLEGATLEEIAEALDVPLSSYPYLDRSGTTPDGIAMTGFSAIPGIASDDRLLQAVFTGDIGFESDIVPSANGGLAVFRVTDTIPSAPEPFEESRGEAVRLWKSEQLSDALTARGVELAARLRAGESIEVVAGELGAEVENIAVQRSSPLNTVSPAVLIGLLDGEVGAVARGPGQTPGTYEIAILDTVSSAGERVGGQMLDIIRGQVSEQIALDVSQAYQDAILADAEHVVFEDQLRAVLNLDAEG
ncbi:peptidylprolyl isomerase [uncultured Algimonas sp.]|uniref:peptidylprolyl isomerase n=1 Tax=uncultured Algimonas sp. TaxID=1547920 RepID=UPI002613A1A6|nr:peptidylprolyl isomerase [uncultured Algimonas sp.]